MKRSGSFLIFLMLAIGNAVSWALDEEGHDHDHHGHDVSGPELGMSVGYVHLDEEGEDVLGVHAHLLQRLGDTGFRRYFAFGVGGEYLFSDEAHYALMISLAAYPWRGLALSISPGVQWAEHDGKTEAEYSTHLEAAYTIPVGAYDLGPVIDYSWTGDEDHVLVGLHVGLHF